MIYYAITLVAGFLLGMFSVALLVLAHEADRAGRPPRGTP